MPNYLKPQSPLYSKENDAYFYPLTTSDQVIMPDGSRLNDTLSMELLWENPSPDSDFGERIVVFDKTDCKFFVVVHTTTNRTKILVTIVPNNESLQIQCRGFPSGSTNYRSLNVEDSGIYFYDCFLWTTAGNKGTVSNSSLVPLEIYGIKGVSV